MNLLTWASLLGLAVILLMSTYFMFHKDYQDGVLGRIGLALLGFSSFVVLIDAAHGTEYAMLPSTAMLIWGVCLFLMRHCWRFRRYLQAKSGAPGAFRACAECNFGAVSRWRER